MEDESRVAASHDVALTSTAGAPFVFEVGVAGAGPGSASRCFAVTGTDPATGSSKTREYRLTDTQHNAYLDFLENLARDFGTRVPRNRRPRQAPAFEAPFRALLTRDLSPGILYGYGDPAVIRVAEEAAAGGGCWYYLAVTSNDAPDAFPLLRSRDLEDWRPVGFVFPEGQGPRWAAEVERGGEYWAPEMHRVAGGFLVCFAARDKDRAFAIGVAKSSRPDGPFVAADEPILRGDVIDPHILVDPGGAAFLFWKEDTNDLWPGRLCRLLHEHGRLIAELFPRDEDRRTAAFAQTLWPWARSLGPMERFFALQALVEAVASDFSAFRERLAGLLEGQAGEAVRDVIAEVLRLTRTPVYAQRLAPDGLSLVGERTAVLQNDREWEGHLVEGVWVTERRGKYYMFYAGNDFSTARYGIGVAVADAPLGPYRKMEEPLLRSTAEWSGPGHPSVADGPDGEPWLFVHAFFPGRVGYKEFRALLAAPIAFEADRVVLRHGAGGPTAPSTADAARDRDKLHGEAATRHPGTAK
jgi:arabinan endo-1,5-alpha-L-arabinosidase